MKNILFVFSMALLALLMGSCEFDVEFGTPFFQAACNEQTFSEYCFNGAPVWCIDGYEELQDECYGNTVCAEIIDGYWLGMDLADCFDPSPLGMDYCELPGDYAPYCEDSVTDHYDCLAASDGNSYWVLTESEICDFGCDASGLHCY